MLLLMSSGSPGKMRVVSPHSPLIKESIPNEAYQRYLAAEALAVWETTVEIVAERTGIKDLELAEIVALAIEDASGEFDMDPWLIVALIRVESFGDPLVVSYAGAIGLTQIMPATGLEIAKALEIEGYSTDMLYDPTINVRMGTYYLRSLLDEFNGDLRISLAAYNWGPTHIASRIIRNKRLPVQYPRKVLRRLERELLWER